MNQTWNQILSLLQTHKQLIAWIAAASGILFVATLVIIPILIVRMPADYFLHEKRHPEGWTARHPLARWLINTIRSLVGFLFILAGISMLVLPGQGLLTILIGLSLMTFPGKYAFERWLASRKPIAKAMNWIRRRAGRPPLLTTAPPSDTP